MYTNEQMMAPSTPQQAVPGQMSPQDIQKMKLLQAMQSMNSNQAPATEGGAATANALAQALNGYMQGMQMQKSGMGFGGGGA